MKKFLSILFIVMDVLHKDGNILLSPKTIRNQRVRILSLFLLYEMREIAKTV